MSLKLGGTGTGGASADVEDFPYAVLSLTDIDGLSMERRLVDSPTIGFTDGGPNGTLSFFVKPGAVPSTFISHSDTPAAYAGAALKILRVNAAETAVEFAPLTFESDLTYQTDDVFGFLSKKTLTGVSDVAFRLKSFETSPFATSKIMQLGYDDGGGGITELVHTSAAGVTTFIGPDSTTSKTIGLGKNDTGFAILDFDILSVLCKGIYCGGFLATSTGSFGPAFAPAGGTEAKPSIRWFSSGENGFYFESVGPLAGIAVSRASQRVGIFNSSGLQLEQIVGAFGFGHGPLLKMVPHAHVGIDYGFGETIDMHLLGRTQTIIDITGTSPSPTKPTFRSVVFEIQTYAFTPGPGIITDAATVSIEGAPIAGALCTITNSYALWVRSGNTCLGGDLQVKSHAAFAGSEAVKCTGAVQTTDATVTTLKTIPIADTSSYWIHVRIAARETGGADRAVYHRSAMVYREGGIAVLGGFGVQADFTDESDVAWDGTIDVDGGNNARVRVTGVAATTINWACEVTYQRVSGAA